MRTIKIELKWATIFTVVALLWMVLEKRCGMHDKYIDYHMYYTNLFVIPAILLIAMALKDKKTNFYGGAMSYKQGLISGLILSAFIALLSPASQWITSYIITPAYFPNVIKRSVELGYFQSISQAEAYFNYKSYAIQGTIGALVMGIITTAIAMIFIRTKSS